MLAEIISIGGFAKPRREYKAVRLKKESNSVTMLVRIITKSRDTREKVKNETGKEVDNPMYGKFVYVNNHTIELEETTPAEVKEAVLRGIAAAVKK